MDNTTDKISIATGESEQLKPVNAITSQYIYRLWSMYGFCNEPYVQAWDSLNN